jgi:hypothetical protein
MNRETVRQIAKEDLGIRTFSVKMLPRILTHVQKQRRFRSSSDLLRNAEMFDRVITSDETWSFQYDPEAKRQSMQWKTEFTSAEKSTHVAVAGQDHACVFLRSKGEIVRYEFTAQGQTVNQQCYMEVLTRLRESVWRKRSGLLPDKWILHHDNAPAHNEL